jgi:hypothetical protein
MGRVSPQTLPDTDKLGSLTVRGPFSQVLKSAALAKLRQPYRICVLLGRQPPFSGSFQAAFAEVPCVGNSPTFQIDLDTFQGVHLMPPADLQRLFGYTTETAAKPSQPIHLRREHSPVPQANHFDEPVDSMSNSWEAMWIDMGGEG